MSVYDFVTQKDDAHIEFIKKGDFVKIYNQDDDSIINAYMNYDQNLGKLGSLIFNTFENKQIEPLELNKISDVYHGFNHYPCLKKFSDYITKLQKIVFTFTIKTQNRILHFIVDSNIIKAKWSLGLKQVFIVSGRGHKEAKHVKYLDPNMTANSGNYDITEINKRLSDMEHSIELLLKSVTSLQIIISKKL
jgi:hypothetical protein